MMSSNSPSKQIVELEQIIGHNFNNKDLITQALSHPSLKQINPEVKDYQRLELFGDSILGFLITEILYHKFPDHNEGHIAKIKSYLVSKDMLCKIATEINLANYMIMTKGEELSGGLDNPNNLENTMEALIAAIYLDGSMDELRLIIKKLWSKYLYDIEPEITDPKSYLQEWAQNRKYGIPVYEIVKKSGSAHIPEYKVKVIVNSYSQYGVGNSIKVAQKAAARNMLEQIKQQGL